MPDVDTESTRDRVEMRFDIDKTVHRRLKVLAAKREMTLRDFIVESLQTPAASGTGSPAPVLAAPRTPHRPLGKLRFTIDGELHRQLKVLAVERDLTLTEFVVNILQRAVTDPRITQSPPDWGKTR